MGKKSRLKRERRAWSPLFDGKEHSPLMSYMQGDLFHQRDSLFKKHVDTVRAHLACYRWEDVALALNVSELWPSNAASPIRHLFAWRVLLSTPQHSGELLRINDYDAFCEFLNGLYTILPEFPELEDYSPEPDWGACKVLLDGHYRPIFYGSCIERTPDFIEAFRITYSENPQAQADMDLAVAIQTHIIDSMSALKDAALPDIHGGLLNIPAKEFWTQGQMIIQKLPCLIQGWIDSADQSLQIGLGDLSMFASGLEYRKAACEGMLLPFVALSHGQRWYPISVRSAPSVIIDHWAKKVTKASGESIDHSLAQFISERFPQTISGPMRLKIGSSIVKDLKISSAVMSDEFLYLICLVERGSCERAFEAAKTCLIKLHAGQALQFVRKDGISLTINLDGLHASGSVRFLFVVPLGATALRTMLAPEKPLQLLSLPDFITIFDSIGNVTELEDYWTFVEHYRRFLRSNFAGPVDLFASFQETHSVLIEGAVEPHMLVLDPHWGTRWRFKALQSYWNLAPEFFPFKSSGWLLHNIGQGVVELGSRSTRAYAYSTTIQNSTIQILIRVLRGTGLEDGKMLDLFGQLLSDAFHRYQDELSDLPMIQFDHIVFECIPDDIYSVSTVHDACVVDAQPPLYSSLVLVSQRAHALRFQITLNTGRIFAGLSDSKNAAFEIACLTDTVNLSHRALSLDVPNDFYSRFNSHRLELPRYHLKVAERTIDVPDHAHPDIPSPREYKLARKKLAVLVRDIGLLPGRYELSDAKVRIDKAKNVLKQHIEARISVFDKSELILLCIELHDSVLAVQRTEIQRVRQSMAHQVDYDRIEAIEKTRNDYGSLSVNCRYLLEKVVTSSSGGTQVASSIELKELIALVDWYMVLAGASDTLHNGVDVGGVEIDEFYIPEVFYSSDAHNREVLFAQEQAKLELGFGSNKADSVEGDAIALLADQKLADAFLNDIGFQLYHLLQTLTILTRANQYGFSNALCWSYSSTREQLINVLIEQIEDVSQSAAENILDFLTLDATKILWLTGKDQMETDVPFWERTKRAHRYTIRPLVKINNVLWWGAEHASRARNIWLSTVQEGFLPFEANWPTVNTLLQQVKAGIEKRLETRSEEIFKRHTNYVIKGCDFKKRFRNENFPDVGDFDVLAYWPETNTLVTVECKNNQPPYTIKDSRRLRDKIFGDSEVDRNGQMSRIVGRRQFVMRHRDHLINLLEWPVHQSVIGTDVELYVSRQIYYWMVHPPYQVPTRFVRVDMLESFITTEIVKV